MGAFIVAVLLGVLCIVLGMCNRKGQIGSVHWYHRSRITEENRIPFGKAIGTATIIIGVALIAFGSLYLLSELLQLALLTVIGSVTILVGIAIGLIFSIYAMIKYNKGVF